MQVDVWHTEGVSDGPENERPQFVGGGPILLGGGLVSSGLDFQTLSSGGCVASDQIIIEWQPPENQTGPIQGYKVLRRTPYYAYYDLTTNLADTICGADYEHFTLSVVSVDFWGEISDPRLPYLDLTAGTFDWCNYGLPMKRAGDGAVEESDYRFSLAHNRPNPFNASTVLSFTLPAWESWTLTVYDVLGRPVRTIEGSGGPGVFEVPFDGRSDGGTNLASGIYFWRVSTATASAVRKMTILK